VLPYNSTTVKTLIRGSGARHAAPAPTSNSSGNRRPPGAGAETTLNGQQQIVVLRSRRRTSRSSFAQIDGNISPVLRSTTTASPREPSPRPARAHPRRPAPAWLRSPRPVFPTTGVTRKLVDDFGVLPPVSRSSSRSVPAVRSVTTLHRGSRPAPT
jgi:hypothetical protein